MEPSQLQPIRARGGARTEAKYRDFDKWKPASDQTGILARRLRSRQSRRTDGSAPFDHFDRLPRQGFRLGFGCKGVAISTLAFGSKEATFEGNSSPVSTPKSSATRFRRFARSPVISWLADSTSRIAPKAARRWLTS